MMGEIEYESNSNKFSSAYEQIELIGEGAFSQVWKVKEKGTCKHNPGGV